ncbi:MAG: flippase [Anaerolineae bacterium]|jgi:O-antigen/teichoic acid export membrane protein
MSSDAVGQRRAYLRVGRNAAARLAAQVWAKLLALALVALVARYEGAAGLGRYVLITTLIGLTAAATDAGLSIFLMREIAQQPDASRQRELLGSVLPLRMGLASLGSGLLIGLAFGPLFPTEIRRLLPIGALALLPQAMAGALAGFINGHQRMHVTSGLDMAVRFLTVAGTWPALEMGYGVIGVLACTACAGLLGVLLYAVVLWQWRLLPSLRLHPAEWRACLSAAYPFALTGIIAMAYTRLDVVLLSTWQGDVAAGQYGGAYRLWEAVGMIPSSLLDAMFPEMARLAVEKEGPSRLRVLLRRGGPLLTIGGLFLAAAGSALAGRLIPLVFGPAQTPMQSIAAFRILVWAAPAMFLYLLSGHILYALGHQLRVTRSMLLVAIVNLGMNLLVIARWSVLGVSRVALFTAWLLCGILLAQAWSALRLEDRTRP